MVQLFHVWSALLLRWLDVVCQVQVLYADMNTKSEVR